MSRSYASTKRSYIATAASSFVGMLAAVPISFAILATSNAGAVQAQTSTSTAQVNGVPADFAKFAYAYNQGFMAHTASATTTSSTSGATTCSEATVSDGGSGAKTVSYTKPVGGSGGGGTAKMPNHFASMMNSYNTYQSYVTNTSSVTNTNSNNTVGSNNMTDTSIKVEDSKGVLVGVSNDPSVVNTVVNDSYKTDSQNTTTTTNTDSNNTVIDSGNSSVDNTAVSETKVIDSNNSETNNTTNNTTNTETTNKTIDSYNTVDMNLTPPQEQYPVS